MKKNSFSILASILMAGLIAAMMFFGIVISKNVKQFDKKIKNNILIADYQRSIIEKLNNSSSPAFLQNQINYLNNCFDMLINSISTINTTSDIKLQIINQITDLKTKINSNVILVSDSISNIYKTNIKIDEKNEIIRKIYSDQIELLTFQKQRIQAIADSLKYENKGFSSDLIACSSAMELLENELEKNKKFKEKYGIVSRAYEVSKKNSFGSMAYIVLDTLSSTKDDNEKTLDNILYLSSDALTNEQSLLILSKQNLYVSFIIWGMNNIQKNKDNPFYTLTIKDIKTDKKIASFVYENNNSVFLYPLEKIINKKLKVKISFSETMDDIEYIVNLEKK